MKKLNKVEKSNFIKDLKEADLSSVTDYETSETITLEYKDIIVKKENKVDEIWYYAYIDKIPIEVDKDMSRSINDFLFRYETFIMKKDEDELKNGMTSLLEKVKSKLINKLQEAKPSYLTYIVRQDDSILIRYEDILLEKQNENESYKENYNVYIDKIHIEVDEKLIEVIEKIIVSYKTNYLKNWLKRE